MLGQLLHRSYRAAPPLQECQTPRWIYRPGTEDPLLVLRQFATKWDKL